MSEKNFCLIGHPLGHSISPELHNRLFRLSNMSAAYTLEDISPENFKSRLDFLKTLDGFNVTIPHKQRILPFLDEIDSRARRFGAVNTVKCENGRLRGYNTDADGFLRALKSAAIELRGRVLLCGAGGAARMMACEALESGCSLVVATRTADNARTCVEDLGKLFPGADIMATALSGACGEFDLLLNGTPAGMYPNINSCPVSDRVVQKAAAVFDAVYNPGETVLLKKAQANGAKVQGGLPMLVWQAVAAQEIWTGAHFQNDAVLKICGEMEELLKTRYSGGAESGDRS